MATMGVDGNGVTGTIGVPTSDGIGAIKLSAWTGGDATSSGPLAGEGVIAATALAGLETPFSPGEAQARNPESLIVESQAQQQRVNQQGEYQRSAHRPAFTWKVGGRSQI
jgi:hypothetical protein